MRFFRSKAGLGAGYENDNPNYLLKFFNWVPNWIDKYFFNKVLDFLLGIIFLSIIFISIFSRRKNNDIKIEYEINYFI